MSPSLVFDSLAHLDQRLRRWRVLCLGALWLGGLLLGLWLLGLSDLLLRYERAGRVASWGVLVTVAAAGLAHSARVVWRRCPPAAIAARVERACPELDNHLINYVQFAGHAARNVLEDAYLAAPILGWERVNSGRLKNRTLERTAALAFLMAALAAASPWFWTGGTWTNAVLRIVNPFSARAPVTLTRLLDVEPGDTVVERGEPLRLLCRVKGRGGQRVYLDLWPQDDRAATLELGRLAGSAPEEWGHTIAKVAVDMQYRFRAGDARSARYRVEARPPLAFRAIRLRGTPPAYTGLPATAFDGLTETVRVPQGSVLATEVECSEALSAASFGWREGASVPLRSADRGRTWTGRLLVRSGEPLHVAGVDRLRRKVEADVKVELLADRPPEIRIVSPVGRAILAAGAAPWLQWQVTDDYGLATVTVERAVSAGDAANGTPVQTWTPAGIEFLTNWTAALEAFDPGATNRFRVVACDAGGGNVARSPWVVFESAPPASALAAETQAVAAAAATLARLIALQQTNLDTTRRLEAALAASPLEQWRGAREQQAVIRDVAGRLLASPQKPLGTLADTVRRLHEGAMREVIDVLDRVAASAEASDRPPFAKRAVLLETAILRQLTQVENGMARVQEHRRITGLLAMLDALVTAQGEVLEATRGHIRSGSAVRPPLVERQDGLASDLSDFVRTCRREAESLQRSDAVFATSVRQAADTCEARKVGGDMLAAAEQLEQNRPAQAVPPEQRALECLKAIQAALNAWRVAEARETAESLQNAITAAREKMDALVKMQSKVVEAIRATEQQKDRSDKEVDQLEEEITELKANMSEVLAQIATDLHILPELPVGNDLVEDVYQVYEEMKQVKGSEDAPAQELGLQKEDWILDLLKMAAGRLDDMEMWLAAAPDATKRNTENFDREEMPPITTMPMPSELQDIIGELLKQQEDIKDKADDSASNQGSADMPAGWDIAEGEFVNYSAKGKSGNETPDHRELDGRSNIGRQGMSDGETVAGSGKINEGDEAIERRRTRDSAQSGQVQEEDHARAVATGGGKQSGYSEEKGMAGGTGPRRDAATPQGSLLGLQALLRRDAEATYGKASLMHIRTGALDDAVTSMRQAEDALRRGLPIRQVTEFQRRALAALRRTQSELGGAGYADADLSGSSAARPQEQIAASADEAPPQYRQLVSEYFKALSEGP